MKKRRMVPAVRVGRIDFLRSQPSTGRFHGGEIMQRVRSSSSSSSFLAATVLAFAGSAPSFVATSTAFAGDCTPVWDLSLGTPGADSGLVGGMTLHDDGTGTALYVGGSFLSVGGVGPRIAKRTATGWAPLGSGLSNAECYALGSFQGDLYAAGYFDVAGGVPGTAKLARWDGTAWHSIGANLELFSNQLWGLTTWDDGTGEGLYIAGNFQNIGGTTASYIARWDGTNFLPLGTTPIAGNVPLIVFTSHVHDDGSGPQLYIGGRFTSVDGVPASRIARWNGTSWSPVGGGVTGTGVSPSIMSMVTFDDGTGPALYVAGQAFTSAGGQPANRVAKWNGSTWSNVGDGFANGIVWKLAVFNDGSGDKLHAFGTFTASGATPLNRAARWNGTAWEPFAAAENTIFNAVVIPAAEGSGDGDELVIGGQFTTINGAPANRLATYVGCPIDEPGLVGDLDGNGVVDAADLSILLGAWGTKGASVADLDGNGIVDAADLSVLLGAWS
jgi:hypothetical protein